MKRLIVIAAICACGMVFAQEAEAPAPEPPKCECKQGKPCECPPPCECADGEKKKDGGEFRKRGPRGKNAPGNRIKVKKCDCCPECKGVVILPPDAEDGEPLHKFLESQGMRPGGRQGRRGRRPKARRENPPVEE